MKVSQNPNYLNVKNAFWFENKIIKFQILNIFNSFESMQKEFSALVVSIMLTKEKEKQTLPKVLVASNPW